MFETVTTNAAGILTIIALWSTLVWLSTYMYMSEKIRRKNEAFEKEFGHVIDDYIEHYYSDGSWKRMKWEA